MFMIHQSQIYHFSNYIAHQYLKDTHMCKIGEVGNLVLSFDYLLHFLMHSNYTIFHFIDGT
jgi:hypothetical protein